MLRVYHVTETASVPSIMELGLVPAIGPRTADLGEVVPAAVYLFPTMDDVENALMQWLGDWFEAVGDEAEAELSLLVLDIPDHMVDRGGSWEWLCYDTVPPECIVEIRDGY